MSHGVERCPTCDTALVARTNGFGAVYLDCSCGHVEFIRRQADPNPTTWNHYQDKNGYHKQRPVVVKELSKVYRQGMQKSSRRVRYG